MPILLSTILDQKQIQTTYSVVPNMTVKNCITFMNEYKIGAVAVVENEKIVGIFTERDLLTKVIPSDWDINTTPVKKVMTVQVITAELTMTIEKAMKIITDNRVRHLPITDNGKLLGLVSSGDLTKWIVESQELVLDELSHIIIQLRNQIR